MLASLVLSALALTGSAVNAQSTAAVPSCALTCVLSSLPGTGCASYGVSNITCICTDAPFQLAYYTCQQSSCSASDLNAALEYGASTCAANGTPITTSAIPSGFSSRASSSGSGSASSAASSGSASSGSASSSALSSVSAAASSIASSVSSRASSAASAVTSAAAAASSRPASGAVKLVGQNALAAVGMSMLAVVGGVALLF